jgi:hypothetical protein
MPERPEPDIDRVRDALREHDERQETDAAPPPEEQGDEESPPDEDEG